MPHSQFKKEKLYSRKPVMCKAYKYVKILVDSNIKELGSIRLICRFVADILNVNEDSIRRNYQNSLKNRSKSHGRIVLTAEEEVLLCSMVKYIEVRGVKVPEKSVNINIYY